MPQPRRTVLVTGASAGFGAAFADRFAASGADVALVARRRDRLEDLAGRLRAEHGVQAHVLPADLTDPGAAADLAARLQADGVRLSGLVNNAGFGTFGRFVDEDPATIAREIAVNVTAVTLMTRQFLPELLAAGDGVLVNVSSTAGYQPSPNLAVYAATKAYVRSLTEAIWQETRHTGLRVLALAPGPAYTEFFEVVGSEGSKVGQVVTVDQVVDTAMRALRRRHRGPSVIVGTGNSVQATAARLAPTALTTAVAARLTGSSLPAATDPAADER